jgi:hypothetical protein
VLPGGSIVNNLIFGNQDPVKIGASVEEKVRSSVGAKEPVPFEIETTGIGKANVATVLYDVGSALNGGRPSRLVGYKFTLPAPWPASLHVWVERQGVGAYTGPLLYGATLPKPIPGEVTIEDHKSFGTPKFIGDPATAARLNAAKDLAKRVDKLLRTESAMGAITVKAPRTFKLAPEAGGAVLVLGTLPRMTSMGMGAEVDAGEFLAIAATIAAAL